MVADRKQGADREDRSIMKIENDHSNVEYDEMRVAFDLGLYNELEHVRQSDVEMNDRSKALRWVDSSVDPYTYCLHAYIPSSITHRYLTTGAYNENRPTDMHYNGIHEGTRS